MNLMHIIPIYSWRISPDLKGALNEATKFAETWWSVEMDAVGYSWNLCKSPGGNQKTTCLAI